MYVDIRSFEEVFSQCEMKLYMYYVHSFERKNLKNIQQCTNWFPNEINWPKILEVKIFLVVSFY